MSILLQKIMITPEDERTFIEDAIAYCGEEGWKPTAEGAVIEFYGLKKRIADLLNKVERPKEPLKVNANDVDVWVDNLRVHIVRTDEGVVVDIYGKSGEELSGDEVVASTYAHFGEA